MTETTTQRLATASRPLSKAQAMRLDALFLGIFNAVSPDWAPSPAGLQRVKDAMIELSIEMNNLTEAE